MRQRPGQPGSAGAASAPAPADATLGGHAEPVPPGTPRWITPELVALTKKVWNPRSRTPLSTPDAVTILLNTGRLLGVLAGG